MRNGCRYQLLSVFGILGVLAMTSEIGLSEMPDQLLCDNLTSFYGLWKDAAFGNEPNRTERAAWIILGPGGSYIFQIWPASGTRNSEMWRGPIPNRSVALVHTHTVIMDEKPSHRDILVAQKLRMVLYVISREGIWSVAPNGHEKKERDKEWPHDEACICEAFAPK